MPKYYEDVEDTTEKKKYACERVRDELLECLLKSDCCQKVCRLTGLLDTLSGCTDDEEAEIRLRELRELGCEKKTPRQCMHEPTISQECTKLRVAFFECRRSMLDMRTRFRGRKDY